MKVLFENFLDLFLSKLIVIFLSFGRIVKLVNYLVAVKGDLTLLLHLLGIQN